MILEEADVEKDGKEVICVADLVDLMQKSHLGPLHHPGAHCLRRLPNNTHLCKKLSPLLFQRCTISTFSRLVLYDYLIVNQSFDLQ